ncbi:DUF748 domain-containing protein [Zoogloea sp.]|uniref:DUF748 domain-containing protein n=1 Tax=Zoogloea sp. TaxID=49181 RepID=UPI00261B6F68|nr:DUF748 domain-containing protein [Zoogloea sp.]MDD3353633.1 DUF748 domain-containing protein [Zoogloea sp.]
MAQNTRKGARFMRWALGAAAAVALVGVLGFLVAPPVIKSIAEERLTELLHRPVSIEGLSINPYALSAEVRGLRIQEPEGGETALGFASLYANVQLESLLRGGVVVEEVRLVEPLVRLVRLEGQRYNWSDLIDELMARPDDGAKSHFAIHNIRIERGQVRFDDRPAGKQHAITDLELGVPFVSNLPAQIDTFVEPRLSMKVNESPFEILGKSRPFSATRESVLELKFDDFDLTRYVAYLPGEHTFRLPSARMSSELTLSFAQPAGGRPEVVVTGGVGLADLELQHRNGQPAVRWARLQVEIERLAPMARELVLGQVRLERPELAVGRSRDGRISLLDLLPAAPAAPAPSPPASEARPFALTLGEFRLEEGRLSFSDDLPDGPFHKTIQDIRVSLRGLSLAGGAPAELDLSFAGAAGETFKHTGTLGLAPLTAAGTLNFAGVDLTGPRPYYAAALGQGELLSGTLEGALDYAFAAGAPTPRVTLQADSLALRDLVLRIRDEKSPFLKLGLLEVRDASVDTRSRTLSVGELAGKATRLSLLRGKDGHFNAEKLIPTAAPGAAAPRSGGAPAGGALPVRGYAPPGKEGPDWQVNVKRIALDDWGVRLEDQTLAPAVVLDVTPLTLKVEGLSTVRGSQAKVSLQAAVNKRGRFGVAGSLGLTPLEGKLDLDVRAVDLAMLQPYVTERVKIAITRGHVSARGRLAFAAPPQAGAARGGGLKAAYQGSLSVGNFASVDKLNAADFLKWKSLHFSGMDLRLSPLAVSIDEIALSDFYTRLILDAQGGLNIREITAREAPEHPVAEGQASAAPAAATAQPAVPVSSAPLPPILIRRITLQGGNIAYSDRFIRPNYDANLTGMGGRLTGLSTDPGTIAELDLRGRVDNAAPVTVAGRLNPFRQDKALDIHASVKDFELSGVSTYAAKYVGYGIEKGKLSADLNYRIEDRKLTATNQVFLDQLTFGERVDSPAALKLPVLLAVSLLKNSRGEIDLNLPVGGSLDDPQFSVAGIVVKVIVNLIAKAITSPFALLGSLLGGNSEELAWLDFEPGFARLPEGAETKLAAIARALNEKSGLRLDIAGRVDPERDPEGLKRALLLGRMEALKIQDRVKRGETVAEEERIQITEAEYPGLLARVYKQEKFPKPRNLVGLAKELPAPEMEKLILAHIRVGEDELRLLAQQRAQVAKNWLLEQGKVPADRVFLVTAKEGDEDRSSRARPSRVDFSLR